MALASVFYRLFLWFNYSYESNLLKNNAGNITQT